MKKVKKVEKKVCHWLLHYLYTFDLYQKELKYYDSAMKIKKFKKSNQLST